MMQRLLMAISGRLPCRIIKDGDQPYLERYYLFTALGTRVYLHRFVGSDPDRGLHDHPWPWAFSVILSGFYIEERRGIETEEARARIGEVLEMLGVKPSGIIRRPVNWFNWLTGDSFHRVILPEGRSEVWTLFGHRAMDSKQWGFLRDKGQIGMVFTPYTYPAGQNKKWWKTAPKGSEVRNG